MSLEQFFKAFFGEEVEIHYPKNDMFIVGESKLFGKDHSPLENHSGEKIRERATCASKITNTFRTMNVTRSSRYY